MLMSIQQSKSKPIRYPATLCLLAGFVLVTVGGVFLPPRASLNFAPNETNLLANVTLRAAAFAPLDRSDSRLKSKTGRRQSTPSQALSGSVPVFARSVSVSHLLQYRELYAGSRNSSLPRDRAPPNSVLPEGC
jgi:hypothetical protein